MNDLSCFRDRTGLLVSVRGPAEVDAALGGGADIIDIKEPNRGSLGAADPEVIAAIFSAVAGRAPISVAAGELLVWSENLSNPIFAAMGRHASFVKLGLAGCAARPDWPHHWQAAFDSFDGCVQPVAVAYADWQAARAPTPDSVLDHALELGCRVLLVDTWSKSDGDLFDRWPAKILAEFAGRARAAGIDIVLAGSIRLITVAKAVACRPTLVAVRGAVCEGGRGGTIAPARVVAVRAALDAAQPPRTPGISDSACRRSQKTAAAE